MAKVIRAFCAAAAREHYIEVDQLTYDMWADHSSPLYQPKPHGHGGHIECAAHRSWAFLPGAMPAEILTPPHVKVTGRGVWNENGFYEQK